MTINDLAFEMSKNKENPREIKDWENKIKSWENLKDYPTLDEIYKMAYIIELNPGELMALRNRGRKQFFKDSNEPKIKKHDWIEIGENTSYIVTAVAKLVLIFGCVIFCIGLLKFVDTFFGVTGGIVEDQVMVKQIQKHTDSENIINDGTVGNMVNRILKEEHEERLNNIKDKTSNDVDE